MDQKQDAAEHIGLLFVHGIGEQKRFEHLKASAHDYAELLLQTHDTAVVTVTDRTEDWPHPAGVPAPGDIAPLTISVSIGGDEPRRVHFECHEVWWADLGTRDGLFDVITFWLWGLGQWGAPLYREMDASGLPKDKRSDPGDPRSKLVSRLTRLPDQIAGQLGQEPWTRFRLALAGLAALLVAVSWMLVKRGLETVLGQAPSPTLLVRYVGDVRTYESRWTPGDSNLTDPGHPRRVAIRRRMVAEMVAMGARAHRGTIAGWYVCAHSLGTVVAYNGLTEIAHALPNYLSEYQWRTLPDDLRHDPDCLKRRADDMHHMMPARPDWLKPEDVIHRRRLFARLRGFITYGSPLDKFAALWPRIVATATDQQDARGDAILPFPGGCEWLNLASPEDPVAGTIDSYGTGDGKPLERAIPAVFNIVAPIGWAFGLAHIRYFLGVRGENQSIRTQQKRAIMRWLLQRAGEPFDQRLQPPEGVLTQRQSPWLTLPWLVTGYLMILAALTAGTAGLWLLVGKTGRNLLDGGDTVLPGWAELGAGTLFTLGAAMSVVLTFGFVRWFTESRGNRQDAERAYACAVHGEPGAFSLRDAFFGHLAAYHEKPGTWQYGLYRLFGSRGLSRPPVDAVMEIYWRRPFWLFFWQTLAAFVFLAPTLAALALALLGLAPAWLHVPEVLLCWSRAVRTVPDWGCGYAWPIGVAGLLFFASIVQTLLNKIVPTAAPRT